MKLPTTILATLLLAASAFAADVDGKWAGTLNTPNGDVPVSFTFKADADKLSGSSTGPDGNEVKIADGKVDGKNITFSLTVDFGGMPLTLNYKGVVEKDQIKLTLDFGGMPFDFVVKKAS
jgi:hypothetical protein